MKKPLAAVFGLALAGGVGAQETVADRLDRLIGEAEASLRFLEMAYEHDACWDAFMAIRPKIQDASLYHELVGVGRSGLAEHFDAEQSRTGKLQSLQETHSKYVNSVSASTNKQIHDYLDEYHNDGVHKSMVVFRKAIARDPECARAAS